MPWGRWWSRPPWWGGASSSITFSRIATVWQKRKAGRVLASFIILKLAIDNAPFIAHTWGGPLVKSESRSVVSDSLRPHGLYSPWNSPGQNPSPEDLPNPGVEPRSPALQVDSLPAEPQGKPKNTGVDSLSFLQLIFPTQELNRGLLHCRPILTN